MSAISPNTALRSQSGINVNKWFQESRFNRFHLKLSLLGLTVNLYDGYDMFIYAAAIPLMLKAFHMNPAQAGAIAGYTGIGAAIGSLVLGSAADKVGRKRVVLSCVTLISLCMVLCGLMNGPASFGFFRFLTGFGIGGAMPNIAALVTEFAPARTRSIMLALVMTGIQFGGMTAALLGLLLFPLFGWRSVFVVGALPIVLLPVYIKSLPESPVQLVKRNRLSELRDLLRRARPGDAVPEEVPLEAATKERSKVPLATIFQNQRGFSTIMFWAIYFLNLYAIYGFTIWLPKLIINHGYSLRRGLAGLLLLSVASIVGTYVGGFIADRIGSRATLIGCYVLSFSSIILVGYTNSATMLMVLIALTGAGHWAQNLMNPYIGAYYPPSMRSTAMGFAYGLGRLGAIFGPTLVGVLMNMHFSYRGTLLMLAIPALLPAFALLAIREKYNFARQVAAEEQLATVR